MTLRPTRSVRDEEIVSGSLVCETCRSEYPILGGVAILIEDVGDYLLGHVKGIAREIPESEFPKAFRVEMARARRELSRQEHIEEDLESQRVTALYVITQYLEARQVEKFAMSDEMRELVRCYWDQGPFSRIRAGIDGRLVREGEGGDGDKFSLLELGCGVGGLLSALSHSGIGGRFGAYLGVDSSFSSIALARRLALGLDHRQTKTPLKVPEDLLFGAVSRDVTAELGTMSKKRALPEGADFSADFIVGDAVRHPLRAGGWDACVALNLIDMLDRPGQLPETQKGLIRSGGWAIQSSPYIWHPDAAKELAGKYPRCRESSEAVAQLYGAHGFVVERDSANIPWLFFKNARQIELYSVDLMFARLSSLLSQK